MNTLRHLAIAASLFAAMATTQAQDSRDSNVPPTVARQQAAEIAHGDPARWYQPDKTIADHLRSLRKEIGAELQEQQGSCRLLPRTERANCMHEAKANYDRDMAEAPKLAAQRER